MQPLHEDNLSEAFFDAWRQLRRGDFMKRMIPLFSDIASLNLSPTENDILQVLIGYPEGCDMGTVAGLVGLDPGNLTRTVGSLEKKGLARRFNQKKDSRKRILKLTEAGLDISQLHVRLRVQIFKHITEYFSVEESKRFVQQLVHIVNQIEALDLSRPQMSETD